MALIRKLVFPAVLATLLPLTAASHEALQDAQLKAAKILKTSGASGGSEDIPGRPVGRQGVGVENRIGSGGETAGQSRPRGFLQGRGSYYQTPLDPGFVRKLAAQRRAILIDARTPGERCRGYVKGAMLHSVIDQGYESLVEKVARLVRDESRYPLGADTPVMIYCRSGARAGRAQAAFQSAAFTQAENIGGLGDLTLSDDSENLTTSNCGL